MGRAGKSCQVPAPRLQSLDVRLVHQGSGQCGPWKEQADFPSLPGTPIFILHWVGKLCSEPQHFVG